MALIDRIEELMLSDDEDRDNQSGRLMDEYESASKEVKAAVDSMFICLCGYSLKTIIAEY